MVKAANHQLFPDFYPSQMPSSHWHNPVMSKSTGGVRVQDREWERVRHGTQKIFTYDPGR